MPISLNTAISALDTPSSLLPFFVKDACDITGRTVMANNEGGKHEAREKFIEEFGTSVCWVFGIPAIRKIINHFAKNRFDTSIQFKRINTDGIQNYYADKLDTTSLETVADNAKKTITKKFSPEDLKGIILGGEKLEAIKDKLNKTGFKPNGAKGGYKTYHVGVTTAAVLVNLVLLTFAIPQLNQLLSRKLISKEINSNKNNSNENPPDAVSFGTNNKVELNDFLNTSKHNQNKKPSNNKNQSFGSLKDLLEFKNLFNFADMAEKAQLNPVNGMLLLDYGISGSRVTITPRNNNERIENAIKEGGIIFFFYYAADIIKGQLAKIADKYLNTPIDLDYKILNNKDFKDKFKNPHNKDELLKFVELEKDDAKAELKVIKMIDQELANAPKVKEMPKDQKAINLLKESVFKNFTLQMAQKEGLIDVEYDNELEKWIRDSKKYIQTDKVIDLNKNLKTFYDKALYEITKSTKQIKNSSTPKTIEDIISKTKKVKIASIFANMAICCASLSFIVPKIQYMIREHRTKTKAAPGIKMYQELAAENKLKV